MRGMRALLLLAFIGLAGCVTTNSGNLPESKPDLRRAARINTELGVNYLREGRYAQAETKLQRAVKQDPGYAAAHAALAFLYSRRGQPTEARAAYQRALSLDDDNARVHNSYAVFLCSRKEYDEAMAQFDKAINSRGNDAREVALDNAGVCERRRGRLHAAETYFRRALSINANYSPALLQMADLSYREHNYLQAQAFIRRYHDIAQESAASLALAYRIEQALGNDAAAAAYRGKLQQKYPGSDRTVGLSQSVEP